MTHTKKTHGFSLIEVLVALVVLSIGMIGIAAMQVQGLQFGQQALTSNRAIGLVADMADRIGANSKAQTSDPSTTFAPGDAYAVDTAAPAASPATNCADSDTVTLTSTDVCIIPATLAAYDIWAWKTAIANSGLVNGTGKIDYAVANGVATFDIEINWDERGEARVYQLRLQR